MEISAKCPSRDQDAEVGTLMPLPAGKGFGLVFWRNFWARERAVARTGTDLSLWSGPRLETTSKQGPSAQVNTVTPCRVDSPGFWLRSGPDPDSPTN